MTPACFVAALLQKKKAEITSDIEELDEHRAKPPTDLVSVPKHAIQCEISRRTQLQKRIQLGSVLAAKRLENPACLTSVKEPQAAKPRLQGKTSGNCILT